MRKYLIIFLGVVVLAFLIGITSHYVVAKINDCAKIQDGTILASTGEILKPGYDEFGYNYQAHLFNGRYCDYDRVFGGAYCDVHLLMKWNDAWLSNQDCDGDNLLDRHYPLPSYSGSGAWLTNHQQGTCTYIDKKGREKTATWTYFVKIVAAPLDAYTDAENLYWYEADGTEIGPVIWGAFAVIQEVLNDPCEGVHGILYKSPAGPGFGKW